MDDEQAKSLTIELQALFAEFGHRTTLLYASHGIDAAPAIAMVIATASVEKGRPALATFRLHNVPGVIADLLLVQGLEKSLGEEKPRSMEASMFMVGPDGAPRKVTDPKELKRHIDEMTGGTDCDCEYCKFVRGVRGR